MSIPTVAPERVARIITTAAPAYHFEIPGNITSISTYYIPADTVVYISADKLIDGEFGCFDAWRPKHGLAEVSFFSEYGEEFEGYINFELMWQNSIFIDD